MEPKNEPQRRGKKQKRFDLSSKKTILDELQERQQREQKEAREHIKNEIAKREKLLETIDLVLDCHKSEAELAKNQQESLNDVKKLTLEAAKVQSKPSTSKAPKKSQGKKTSPNEEELVNKIEQVLGMTKLEIKNAQTNQAYIGRLEAEVAKVKQSKDILLGGQSAPVVPPHIKKMATEIKDLTKEVPKTKEELVKEIESRDVLMAEINRVLDTTKSEIDKVQKQQKIIQNLEVELTKMKEQEIVEKIAALAEEVEVEEEPEPPPKQQSAATASLLDALMANVGKLKEMQAMKEKQKAEQPIKTEIEQSKEPDSPVVALKENEKAGTPPKSSTEQSKKQQQKDQKIQPQKKQDVKPVSEEQNVNIEPKTKNVMSNEEKKIETAPQAQLVKQEIAKETIKEHIKESPKTESVKPESPKIDKKPVSPKDIKKNQEQKPKSLEKVETKLVTNDKKEIKEVNPEPKVEKLDQKSIESKTTECEAKVVKAEPTAEIKLEKPVEVKSAPVDVKPITSTEPKPQDKPKTPEPKKNDQGKKGSPKNSHKNKHNKQDKKDSPKGVPEVVDPPQMTTQKPSMAEMLKNAPDPPTDEIETKPSEEEKSAPLARPESAIIEVKPSDQVKDVEQNVAVKGEKKIEEPKKEIEKVSHNNFSFIALKTC